MARNRRRWLALPVMLSLTVVACGSDREASSETSAASQTTTAPATTEASAGADTEVVAGGAATLEVAHVAVTAAPRSFVMRTADVPSG